MRTHSRRALQSPGKTDLGILLMEGFFPAGCMPALSSVPSRAGCLCTVHPWTLSPAPALQPGGKPESALPWVVNDNRKLLAGKTASWAACFCSFPICSTQFAAGRSGLFVPASTTECPRHGPGLWSCAQCVALCLDLCPGVVSVCTGCLSLQPPALQSSP